MVRFPTNPFSRVPARAKTGGSAGAANGAADPLIDGPIARAAPNPVSRVSVYAELVHAAKTLEALVCAPESNPAFAADIGELADTLRKACALDPDAALAHIMF